MYILVFKKEAVPRCRAGVFRGRGYYFFLVKIPNLVILKNSIQTDLSYDWPAVGTLGIPSIWIETSGQSEYIRIILGSKLEFLRITKLRKYYVIHVWSK